MRFLEWLILSLVVFLVPSLPNVTILDQARHDGVMVRAGWIKRSTIDAYLDVETADGTLSAVYFDAGEEERYVYLAFLDTTVVAIAEIGFASDSLPSRYEIHAYSQRDGSILRKDVPSPIEGFGNFDNMLCLRLANGQLWILDESLEETTLTTTYETSRFQLEYRGSAKQNGENVAQIDIQEPGIHTIVIDSQRGIVQTFVVTIPFESSGLTNGLVSADPVVFQGNGSLFLDGSLYESGTRIDQPGYHVLTQMGQNAQRSFSFLITPSFSGFTEGITTTAPVKIRSNAMGMTLNSVPYVAGTTILTPARYTLELLCANGYVETHSFVLLPSLRGVRDQEVYEEIVVVYVNGMAYLDGVRMNETTTIRSLGEHEIVLMWEDEVWETIHFNIVPSQEDDAFANQENLTQILIGCMGVVGLFWIFHKKKPQMPK